MDWVSEMLNIVWHAMMQTYSGWLPCVIENDVYLKVIATGVITYAVVALLLTRHTNRVPLEEALKNVE